jgi:serine/threonine protein kinase/tetratricopeptide (TPR) repeat protein
VIGKIVSHYKIISKLGEGGMGVVYTAKDTKLDRMVALKFLPPEATSDTNAKARFLREAKAASALDHNNICTIFEVNETEDGRLFLAMARYEGETLKEKITRGPLPVEQALDITRQVAEGLAKAHEQNIIHRDIKPSNLFLTTDNVLKVLDFGLAKLSGLTRLTKEKMTLGTTSYMSPEQFTGEDVDQRSDIWALGVVLFEMITGEMPFRGDYEQAVMYSIMNETPKPLRSLRPEVPAAVADIVGKMLSRNLNERYQTSAELIADLQSLVRRRESRGEDSSPDDNDLLPSIAILPFTNLSADPEQEFFCDGIVEEIINALARLNGLRVVARTSAFSYKGQTIDVREIGTRLNVRTLLEGSVRKAGNSVRILVQLVNVEDGCHLWSEKFDRDLDNIFAIQDEISLAIVESLKLRLMGDERERLLGRHTENVDAHIQYLKGRYFWNKRTKEDLNRAFGFFQRAIDLDPHFSLAHAGLADYFVTMGTNNYLPLAVAMNEARKAARTALENNNQLGEAHASLAVIKTWLDWDWKGAEKAYRKALELNPSCAEARHQYSHLLSRLARHQEAIREMKHALRLEPVSLNINACLGQVLFLARRYDDAIEQLQKTIEMDPEFYDGHSWLGMAFLQKGLSEQALAKFEQGRAFSVIQERMNASIAYTYAVTGQENRARKLLAALQGDRSGEKTDYYLTAVVYAGLGEVDRAIADLKQAYEERSVRLFTMVKVDPLLDNLRSDPRFTDLLRAMKLTD